MTYIEFLQGPVQLLGVKSDVVHFSTGDDGRSVCTGDGSLREFGVS